MEKIAQGREQENQEMQLWIERTSVTVCPFNFPLIISVALSISFPFLYISVSLSPSLPLSSSCVRVSFYILVLYPLGPLPHGLLTQVPAADSSLTLVSLRTHSWEALTASIGLCLDRELLGWHLSIGYCSANGWILSATYFHFIMWINQLSLGISQYRVLYFRLYSLLLYMEFIVSEM